MADYRKTQKAIADVLDFQKANPKCSRVRLKREIASIVRAHGITREAFYSALKDCRGRLDAECARRKARLAQLAAEIEELEDQLIEEHHCGENDVEGASVALAALRYTHPNRDGAYYEEENRIFCEYCPLLAAIQATVELREPLEERGDELIDMITDGAERLLASQKCNITVPVPHK